MKKGFWNYTEPITYCVVIVRLFPVRNPPMHWQNAFAGKERQAVEVTSYDGNKMHQFYIDNGDGSGLKKIDERGGPGSMSRHIEPHAFEIVDAFPSPATWLKFDPELMRATDQTVEDWQRTHFPDEFARLQAMKESWAKSDITPVPYAAPQWVKHLEQEVEYGWEGRKRTGIVSGYDPRYGVLVFDLKNVLASYRYVREELITWPAAPTSREGKGEGGERV